MQRSRKRLRLSSGRSTAKRLAMRFAFKGAKTLVKSRLRRSQRDTPALTFQNDNRWIYRRRRAPMRVKKYVRRMRTIVNKVVDNKLPFNVMVFNWIFPIPSLLNQQNYFFIPLYTGQSAPPAVAPAPTYAYFNFASQNQLAQILTTNTTPAQNQYDEQNIQFDNATSDIVIAADTANPVVAIVTVHHCWARKDSNTGPLNLFVDGITNKSFPPLDPTNTIALTSTTLATTPFDSSRFCQVFLIKNTREFRISPGTNITLQLRDRKEYTINSNEVIERNITPNEGFNRVVLSRYTEGYFVFFRGTPQGINSAPIVNLTVSVTNRYRYRLLANQFSSARLAL